MSLLTANNTYNESSNQRLFKVLSVYLNLAPDYIDRSMIEEITCGDVNSDEFAFANLAATACGLDIYENAKDKTFFRSHFLPAFKKLDISPYLKNEYYNNIKFLNGSLVSGRLKQESARHMKRLLMMIPKCLRTVELFRALDFLMMIIRTPRYWKMAGNG